MDEAIRMVMGQVKQKLPVLLGEIIKSNGEDDRPRCSLDSLTLFPVLNFT